MSDLTVLEGVYEGTGSHIFAFAPTRQSGIQFAVRDSTASCLLADIVKHNWDNIGLRLTESGSVKIDNVAVPWSDALGYDPQEKKPLEAIQDIPWATLLLPT